jgi:amino acid transporter
VRRAAIPLVVWAVLLTCAAVALWIYSHSWLNATLITGAAVLTYLIALGFVIRHRRMPDASEARAHPELAVRAVPDLSFGSALIGIAIATMVFGVEFGLFLVYIGAGLLLLGVVILAIEVRGERRALREAGR